MDELKKCPFCGDEAEVYTYVGERHIAVHIQCKGCLAQMGADRPLSSATRGDLFFTTDGDAVAAWNRRTGGEE